MNIQLLLVVMGLVVSFIVIPATQVLQHHLDAPDVTAKERVGACVAYAVFTVMVIFASSYVSFMALWALALRA